MATPCQLLFVERQPFAVHLDLVALEPIPLEETEVPVGSPIALALRGDWRAPGVDQVLGRLEAWSAADAVVRFDVVSGAEGDAVLLTCGVEQVVLATKPAA
ncbi:MAG: hypothetical protein ACRD29_10820 [Acidimicrobiales bacterium]